MHSFYTHFGITIPEFEVSFKFQYIYFLSIDLVSCTLYQVLYFIVFVLYLGLYLIVFVFVLYLGHVGLVVELGFRFFGHCRFGVRYSSIEL